MKQFDLFGFNIKVGKDNSVRWEDLNQDQRDVVNKLENMIEKGFTYDRLFTTGHQLDMLVGTRVNKPYETAESVYKSVSAILDNVPQAEAILLPPNSKTPVKDSNIEFLLSHTTPDHPQTFKDFLQEWIGFYSLNGEAFIHKVQSFGQLAGTRNLPAELHNLNPQYMKEVVDKASDRLIGWNYKEKFYSKEEIIHTKNFNPYNKWRGLSPLKPITDELQIEQASLIFNLSFFKNDASPGLILSTEKTLTKDQRAQIKEYFEKKHQGSRNAFMPAVLESGLKAEKLQNTHKDMEFTQQMNMMFGKVLGIWRVPEGMFNNVASLNYSTFMGQMRVFWIYTLIPYLNKFSDMMDLHIVQPYNQNLKFDFDLMNVPAFQEELYTKKDMIETLWKIGFTNNEINDRLELGFPKTAQAWKDEAWVMWNTTTAQNAIDNPRVSETINTPGGPGEGEIEAPGSTPAPKKEPTAGVAADATQQPAPKKKSINEKTFRRQLISKGFNDKADQVEAKMKSKMRRYFYELGKEALHTPKEALVKGIVHIDWAKADEKLQKYMKPLIWEAIQHGLALGKRAAGEGKGVNEDAAMHGYQSLLSVNSENITGINDRMKSAISDKMTTMIQDGASSGAKTDEVLAVITDGLKNFFNGAINRASMIARTESASAMNGASHLYYESIGVTKKSWVTSHDNEVRDGHLQNEDDGPIPITATFGDGCMYPGDQNADAGEVINCRCTLAPEVD